MPVLMATKLYVGNLPDSAKEKDLRDLFQSFGDVSEVAVLRGYGFVVSPAPHEKLASLKDFEYLARPPVFLSLQHFIKSDDAAAALDALDGSEFMEARLQVEVQLNLSPTRSL